MKAIILLIIFTLNAAVSVTANADSALFNGLSVDLTGDSISVEADNRLKLLLDKGEPQKLIIEYKDSFETDANLSKAQNTEQRLATYNQIKAETLQSFDPSNIEEIRDYSHLPMSVVRVNSVQGLEQLMAHPQVKAVHENTFIRPQLNQSLPLIRQSPTKSIGLTGVGAAVAILDTGVDYTHPAFGSCTSPGVPSSCKVVYTSPNIAPTKKAGPL